MFLKFKMLRNKKMLKCDKSSLNSKKWILCKCWKKNKVNFLHITTACYIVFAWYHFGLHLYNENVFKILETLNNKKILKNVKKNVLHIWHENSLRRVFFLLEERSYDRERLGRRQSENTQKTKYYRGIIAMAQLPHTGLVARLPWCKLERK